MGRNDSDRKYNKRLISNARALRKDMTREERHLWYDYLRNAPQRFVRQKVLGRYIADFYCASAKLVIELDGSQHYEASEMEYDSSRTEYLEQFGIRVIRIPNNEINANFSGVCSCIDMLLEEATSDNPAAQPAVSGP